MGAIQYACDPESSPQVKEKIQVMRKQNEALIKKLQKQKRKPKEDPPITNDVNQKQSIIKSLQKKIMEKDLEIKILELKNIQTTNQFQKQLSDQKQQMKKVKTSSNQSQNYEQKLSELSKQIKQQHQQNQTLKANNQQIDQKFHELQLRQQKLQKIIVDLRDEMDKVKQSYELEEKQYETTINQLSHQIQNIRSQKENNQKEMLRLKFQAQSKIKQSNNINNHKYNEQKSLYQQQIHLLTKEFEEKNKQNEKKIVELESYIDQINNKKRNSSASNSGQTKDLKQKLDRYLIQLEKVRLSRERKSAKLGQLKYASFFNMELLQQENDYKQFLAQTIERNMGKTITKTRLLYKFDQLNKANVHKYIDNKYSIVVIIKLMNGHFLAAYSEGPFYPKMQSKYDGMIISLTSRKVYHPLNKNKRAIAYDDYFIIFGNSEVRLKTQQKKIFSNFGVSNGYYQNNGDKVDVLFGTMIRQLEISSYQFYEVIFK